MCGIAGLFARGAQAVPVPVLRRMVRVLEHRGPDGQGLVAFSRGEDALVAADASAGATPPGSPFAAFGHLRLAIIDLSPTGRQPMMNEDGRVWITFNGEIYNFHELRAELEKAGHAFRSTSDTEVLLHGYEEWGARLPERLNGMFALAILDARDPADPSLFLARDRFGQKPLYYAEVDGVFAFASEMKALLEVPGLPRDVSLAALDQYLTFLWVPEPETILASVRKLPAAHRMLVTRSGTTMERYWTLSLRATDRSGDDDVARELRSRLERAVARTTIADVPVAAFLSGGLDSTAIVTLMARGGNAPLRTFTVGYSAKDQAYEGFPDDLRYAREVAKDLGLPQEESVLTADVLKDLPRLVWHLDEPMADPAILPLYGMCVAARPHTKVLLSGMGGDEIFAGYRRHAAWALARAWSRAPALLRRAALPAVERLPSAGTGRLVPAARRAKRLLRGFEDPSGIPCLGLASWTTRDDRLRLYAPGVRERVEATKPWERVAAALRRERDVPDLEQMLLFDALWYLPSHNLNYTDKISMAASVEVRAPLLDNEIVDYVATLPARQKVRGRETKAAFRRAMRGLVPDAVLTRGKTGLGAPIRAWLAGPLRGLVEEVLSPERVRKRGLFAPEAVGGLLEDLESGREDTSHTLWALLVLELWMEAFDARGPAS